MTTQAGVHEKGTFHLSDAVGSLKNEPEFQKAGAMAMFVGVVRGETLQGEKVQKLILESYEEKANEALAKICSELSRKSGIINVQIHHLLGEFGVGEELVYVLVTGSHRKNVFPVLEKAVERYKREVPIFKKEYIVAKNGKKSAYWVEERGNDA